VQIQQQALILLYVVIQATNQAMTTTETTTNKIVNKMFMNSRYMIKPSRQTDQLARRTASRAATMVLNFSARMARSSRP
jgi:hypothetical protein